MSVPISDASRFAAVYATPLRITDRQCDTHRRAGGLGLRQSGNTVNQLPGSRRVRRHDGGKRRQQPAGLDIHRRELD